MENRNVSLVARLDLRYGELRGFYSQGLNEYKVDISKLPEFKSDSNVLFTHIWPYPGTAKIHQLLHKELLLDKEL